MHATRDLEPLAALRPLPEFQFVTATDIPELYRSLLVHHRDMTSTLQAHHRAKVRVHALRTVRNGNEYLREVVLLLEGSSAPVEYGAIRIALDAFPAAAQQLILEARQPLGAIMEASGITYTSQPKVYICVESDEAMNEALRLPAGCSLFGRCNVIYDTQGRTLADLVEILPP